MILDVINVLLLAVVFFLYNTILKIIGTSFIFMEKKSFFSILCLVGTHSVR